MTTAGGQAGGSGFEYGDSTVAARLSIDIPTEGVQSLREITQEISRFRTEMEAASRSQGDFIGFFQTLPSIATQAANAYRTFADQLERSLALQERMAGAVGRWDVQPGSTPDNFKGMSSGMGRATNDINQSIADLDRLREMGQAGERQFLNVHQQRGAMAAGDIPTSNSQAEIAAATDRISSREQVNAQRIGGGAGISMGMGASGNFGGVARQIMNEFGAGATFSQGGPIPHASGEVPHPDSGTSGSVGSGGGGGIGGMLGFPGMGSLLGAAAGRLGLGGMGAMAGVAGPAALAAAGFAGAQYLGPRLQELRELGLSEGGGIKEGAGLELQSRIMAISPFITNDQSRQIIQGALSSGYKGGTKEFETVTKFMADNLKDFALTARETQEMIKKDMVEGGLSTGAIGAGLERDKNLSKTGYLSGQDRMRANATLRGGYEDMGVPGGQAMQASTEITDMFSDSQLLKGTASDIAMNTMDDLGSQATIMGLAGMTPSSDFGDWQTQLTGNGGQAIWAAIRNLAQRTGNNKGLFRMFLQQMLKTRLTQAQANELLKRAMNGGNEATAAAERVNAAGGGDESGVQERSAGERLNAGVGEAVSVLGGTIADVASGNFGNIPQRFRAADFTNQSEHIPILDKLVESQGGDPNKIMVQGTDGEWQKLQPKNSDQLKALSGGAKWRYADDTNGSGYTLAQAPSAMSSSGFGGKQDVSVQGEVALRVTADPGVKVDAPRTFRLTQNQVQANAGWSNATVNNPPPGDR